MLIDGLNLIEGGQITNAVLPVGTIFPTQPNAGELFYVTGGSGGVYVYNGSSWVAVSSGSGGSTVQSLGLDQVDNTSDANKPISIAVQNALDLKVNYTDIGIVTIKNVSGDYTLLEADLTNTLVRVSAAFNTNAFITIPADDSARIGSTVTIASSGLGTVTIRAAAGASVFSPQSLIIDRKYGRVVLVKVDTNTWEVDGQLKSQIQFIMLPNANVIGTLYGLIGKYPEGYSNIEQSAKYTIGFNIDSYLCFSQFFSLIDSQFQTGPQLDWLVITAGAAGNYQYATAEPEGKYFRASVVTGDASGFLNTTDAYSRTYRQLGQWARWNRDDAWGTKPMWATERLISDVSDIEMLIEVAEDADGQTILGSFPVTLKGVSNIYNYNQDIFSIDQGQSSFVGLNGTGVFATENGGYFEYQDFVNIPAEYKVGTVLNTESRYGFSEVSLSLSETTIEKNAIMIDKNNSESVIQLSDINNSSYSITLSMSNGWYGKYFGIKDLAKGATIRVDSIGIYNGISQTITTSYLELAPLVKVQSATEILTGTYGISFDFLTGSVDSVDNMGENVPGVTYLRNNAYNIATNSNSGFDLTKTFAKISVNNKTNNNTVYVSEGNAVFDAIFRITDSTWVKILKTDSTDDVDVTLTLYTDFDDVGQVQCSQIFTYNIPPSA